MKNLFFGFLSLSFLSTTISACPHVSGVDYGVPVKISVGTPGPARVVQIYLDSNQSHDLQFSIFHGPNGALVTVSPLNGASYIYEIYPGNLPGPSNLVLGAAIKNFNVPGVQNSNWHSSSGLILARRSTSGVWTGPFSSTDPMYLGFRTPYATGWLKIIRTNAAGVDEFHITESWSTSLNSPLGQNYHSIHVGEKNGACSNLPFPILSEVQAISNVLKFSVEELVAGEQYEVYCTNDLNSPYETIASFEASSFKQSFLVLMDHFLCSGDRAYIKAAAIP